MWEPLKVSVVLKATASQLGEEIRGRGRSVRARLHRLRKNSVDLKGHGFSSAAKFAKRELALASEGMQRLKMRPLRG